MAVPGELAGYWLAHKTYGKLEWSRLVEPTAELVEKGTIVNAHLAAALKADRELILAEPSMR